jgi:hypothetical protein
MDTFRPLASALLALVTATAAHAVQINQTFEGIDFNGSSCGCLPPSPTAAVGNGFVAQTTNTQFRVFDKPTGNVLLDQPLATLFGASTLGIPNIVYDEGAGRWYVSAFNSAANGLFLAVSRDGNPLDGFLPTYNLTNLGPSPDFPHIGYNADAIFISYNDFGTPSGDATVVTIDKAPALTGSLVDYVSNPPPQFRTMPPAQVHGAPPGVEWFVSTDGNDASGSAIRVTQITNYLGNSPTFTTTLVPVDP